MITAVVVKRFVGGYSGQERYSIRKHPNGAFQAFHDNPYEGTKQGYEDLDLPLTGLYLDAESVETELLRLGLIQRDAMSGTYTTYESVSDLLVKELPELSGPYSELLDYWNGEKPGPYVVYGDILNPFIDEKLREGDREASVRIFRFIENLLLCPDARVADMASVEICEHIVFSDKSIWRNALPFMGPTTQKRCEEIRDWKATR